MTWDQTTAADVATPPETRANGLSTYFGVLFSPGEAFDTLARIPMWGWACVLGLLITVIASIVGLPATLHVAQIAQQTAVAQSSADQQQAARDTIAKWAPFMPVLIIGGSVFFPWIGWIVTALVLLAGAAIGRGVASFSAAWVLAVNSYVIPALGAVIANVILRLQGPENISKPSDAYALPSLAMLVHGDPKTAAVLYAFNVVHLWYYAVLAVGIQRMLKMSAAAAWVTTAIFAILLALLAMAIAK